MNTINSKLSKKYSRFVALTALTFATLSLAGHAFGQIDTLYGNNAGSGPDVVNKFKIDKTAGTGTNQQTYTVSNGNGRGVVVVGNIMYTTQVSDSNIYKTDVTTGAALGTIATTLASMSTLAWDGSHFWTTDYSGTNQGFELDINGNVIKTLTFSQSTGGMDGMEYFNGKLIVNQFDGGFGGTNNYSVYDLNGNLLTANFIGAPNGTGIAYDGTDFLISNVFTSSLNVYDGVTGAFIKNIPYDVTTLVEDLSVDYAARSDTGGTGVEVTGAGSVETKGGQASFAMDVQKNKKAHRFFNFSDPSAGVTFRSNNASNLVITGTHAEFSGSGRIGRHASVTYTVKLDDIDSGAGDYFMIDVSNGYSAAGTLSGGNMSIHK